MPGALISVDEARARVLAAVRPLEAESVQVEDALGRVLAEDVVSDLELPPFDSSAMDGFAVISGPMGERTIVGESQAGRPFDGTVLLGQAVRISTGAVIPHGADAVVPLERVQQLSDSRISAPPVDPAAHIRRAGEDVHRGDLILKAGTEAGPAEIGMLAALGRVDAACARRPRLSIVATGDELVPAGQSLGPGQIHDSNAAALGALTRRAGAEVLGRHRAGDDHATTVAALATALEGADVLCISGGVSVGAPAHVKPA